LVPGTEEDATLRIWLRKQSPLGISSIAWTEFLCGPLNEHTQHVARSLFTEVISFGPDDAVVAAQLFNSSGRRRGTMVDCMVASIAMAADAPLATANLADFRRLEPFGLTLADG
jgi:predicted nucleic acid-binding protein